MKTTKSNIKVQERRRNIPAYIQNMLNFNNDKNQCASGKNDYIPRAKPN